MSRRSALARQWAMLVIAGLLYTALIVYGLNSDTGPMGWLNAAQARSDGSYSRKISLMVLMFAGAVPLLPLWLLLWPRDVPLREPGAPPPTMASRLAAAVVGFVIVDAIVWGAAFGWASWEAHGQNIDAAAAYTPLTLAAAVPLHVTEGDHLALRGRLLGDHVVTRT
ncbi:MAG: hypothetical protein ABI330_04340 [Caldimonas sp.]